MGDAHHCLIESIDWRIGFPIKRAVKFQFLIRERTEFLRLRIGYINLRLGLLVLLLRLSRLTLRFADWLQFTKKIVSEQAGVRIVVVIRATGCFYLLIGWRWSCR